MVKAAGLPALDKAERKRDRRRNARRRRKEREQERSLSVTLGTTEPVQLVSHHSKHVKRKNVKCVDAPKAVNISTFGRLSKCWFLPTKVGDVEMDILVDTGAELSIMSSKMYSQLPAKSHTILEDSDAFFDGIGGRKE